MAFWNKKKSYGSKKAYHSGMGYAVAHSGKGINFKSTANRASFAAGFKAGLSAIAKDAFKYPSLPKKARSKKTKKRG